LKWLDVLPSLDMNSEQLKSKFRENAAEIVRLHARIRETFALRDRGPVQYAEWERACAEFHQRYDALAFPGGYEGATDRKGALDRIETGDPDAMEAAICFLECRPYFFRSGYMFTSIFRRCKRAPISSKQAARFQIVMDRFSEWKRTKKSR